MTVAMMFVGKEKRLAIKTVEDLGPADTTNPVVKLLAHYGVPMAETRSLRFKAAHQDLSSKYEKYFVFLTGARPNEAWPRTGKSFTDEQGTVVLEIWQIVIYLGEHTPCLEARWSVERRDFDVKPAQCRLTNLNLQAVKHIAGALEVLLWVAERLTTNGRGGARNVKVAAQPPEIRTALGSRYVQLRKELETVKRDAKTLFKTEGADWRAKLVRHYPILANHDDLLRDIDPYSCPPERGRIYDQWEIAVELAARETIPNYARRSVSPRTLIRRAILPSKNTD